MKKAELFKEYQEIVDQGKELDCIILYIHMPTGEEETIVNPNVAGKMAYIEKTYNDDLVHVGCTDIYITDVIFSEKTEGYGFGEAVGFLKDGYKVARVGWNGKGMWIRMVEPEGTSDFDYGMENLPYLEMKTADNKLVPWLASQTDILAEDWVIVEEPGEEE